jgi:hypothetical protein
LTGTVVRRPLEVVHVKSWYKAISVATEGFICIPLGSRAT